MAARRKNEKVKPLIEYARSAQKEAVGKIDELLALIGSGEQKHPREARTQAEEGARREAPKQIDALAKVLNALASSAEIRRIECDASGACADGRRVGDEFQDSYGIYRKRGFLNTTRLPVFLDWVLEKGSVENVTETAVLVKTDRGAVALVPADFLCEMQARYGITISGVACEGYKPMIGRQASKTRGRKKKGA